MLNLEGRRLRVSEFFLINVLSDKLQGAIVSARNGKTVLKYRAERGYAGFYDGSFLDEVELREEMETLLSELKKASSTPFHSVFLGVPGEFTTAVVRNSQLDFGAPKRVTDKDADAVLFLDKMASRNTDYVTVNGSPVSYATDNETGLRVVVGKTTSKLICKASYVLAEKEFTKLFDSVAEDNAVKFVYVSSIWSEIAYVLTEDERDADGAGAIFADVGYVSGTLAVAQGDGILYEVSFPEGEGSVAAELNSELDIPFDHALELVRKLNFNLEYEEEDCFTVSDGGKIYRYRMNDVLQHAYFGLKNIAAYLVEALARANLPLPAETEPVYLTGSKMLECEGVAGILENEIGRPIKLKKSTNPDFSEFDMTSLAGLAEVAVRTEKRTFGIKSLFHRT